MGPLQRVSFLVTRKPLAIILDIIFIAVCFIFLIIFFGPAKWALIIPIIAATLFLFPKKNVIEYNRNLKKLTFRKYFSEYCLSKDVQDLKWPKSVDKWPISPLGNLKMNYYTSSPWAVNLPSQAQAAKINKFLGVNPNWGVTYF